MKPKTQGNRAARGGVRCNVKVACYVGKATLVAGSWRLSVKVKEQDQSEAQDTKKQETEQEDPLLARHDSDRRGDGWYEVKLSI